ncbi:MAG: T9SS type A sorting domain-containing protein [Ignavibacteriaceae bacterium]|nr:T9SS type A sorting domain-containing protein [Ignavibacteriaceae bacterium]
MDPESSPHPWWTLYKYDSDAPNTTEVPCIELTIVWDLPHQIVTVDQKLSNSTSVGNVDLYYNQNGNWIGYSVPHIFSWELNRDKILRGSRDVINNEKYNRWNDIQDVKNHNIFTIVPGLSSLISNFKATQSSVIIKNKLVEVNNIYAGKLKFRDPWFINYNDPTNYQDQYGFKNLGSDAIYEWVNSPFNPNTGSGSGSEYKGIFLNQDPSLGMQTYSIYSSPHDINLSQTGRTHQFVWRSWEYDPLKVDIKSPNNKSTNVVFLSTANTTITANLKGTQLSNETTAYDYNSQRKFVRTDNGNLHNVYISLGALWYERSTDGGTTWDIVGGQPINSDNPKQVSIDYLPPGSGTDVVLIAYQCTTSTGSKVVVDVYIDGAPRAGQFRYDVVSFTHTSGEYSQMNAEPVISLAQEWDFLITYKVPGLLPEGGDDPTQAGLYYSFGWLNGLYGWQLTWYNPTQKWVMIPTTGVNSIHPTIGDDVYSGYNYFHIAYQENNQIKYHYRFGQTRTGSLMSGGNPYVCSNNTGFTEHYNPSIISMGTTARVCWVGYRMVYYEEENEVDAFPQYRVLFRRPGQTTFWQFGNNVSFPNINKNSTNTYYAFAWIENNSQVWFADNTLSTVRLLDDVTGQQVQMCNGTTTTNMYCMTYEHNTGVPYYFERSNNLDSYYQSHKIKNNFFSSGREGVVSVDSSEFYFALGDIEVDGQTINFIEIPDTIDVNDLNSINQCLITEPITLSDNTNFIYSVQYGLNDSLSAVQAITGDRFINFKVLLIDDATGQTIGEYDNVTYTQNNLYQYNNISYQVNTQGIGNRTARLKLVLDNNFESEYSLSRIFADGSILGKSTVKQISYSGSEVIKSYELSQNYPNPFNPTTTIKFQIPKAGNVTLRVYDILGNEITTLVEGFKEVGKFEVNFNSSSLASGVYIYRLNVNDYVNVKKMVLLK